MLLPAAFLQAQTLPLPAPSGQAPVTVNAVAPTQVVMSVGDVKITAEQFDRLVDSLPAQYKAQAQGANRKQFADSLVQMLVLAQEAKRQKLDQEEQFKILMNFQIDNMLATNMANELSKNNKPSDAELKKYYDDHKADFEQAKLSHILIRYQGTQAPARPGQKDLTEAEALAKIQSLRQRIEGGEDFAKVAIAESDDTGSGAKGGDLGNVSHGQTVPEFESAAFALKPGEVSQPVKTQFGYHIIKLISLDAKPFDTVRPDIERQLTPAIMQKAIADLVKKAAVTLDPDYFPPVPPAK